MFCNKKNRIVFQMHIGRGIYLDKTFYTLAATGVTVKSKRKFVRNIMIIVFGYDTLAKSTVTGRPSNLQEKPKKPDALDHQKLLAVRGNNCIVHNIF